MGEKLMKQKYTIFKDKSTGNLMIQEYAELDNELFSLVCEETYDGEEIASAVSAGKLKLIARLRTPNLYPIAEYADKIADAVLGFFKKGAKTDEPAELVFDDIKIVKKGENTPVQHERPAIAVIDDLLEEENLDDAGDADDAEEDDELDIFDEEKDE
jgi:hypothetical protein